MGKMSVGNFHLLLESLAGANSRLWQEISCSHKNEPFLYYYTELLMYAHLFIGMDVKSNRFRSTSAANIDQFRCCPGRDLRFC